MSNSKLPLVSIGMPVYNEERYVHDSITALTSQDYDNIEIIISDNCSTDDTGRICRDVANSNSKINYYRFDENKGITNNFNHVLEKSSGKYFMWASGHDIWSTNYISECVNLMESDFTSVIVFGSSEWIDRHNAPLHSHQFGWIDTRGLDIYSRYVVTFWGNMNPILGLINRQHLIARPTVSTTGTDLIVLCRLSLLGNFSHATEAKWSRREFRNESSYKEKLKRYKSKEFGLASSKLDKFFPLIRLPIELTKDILNSNQKLSVKLTLIVLLYLMLPFRYLAGKTNNLK